ncbi:hypothetical protein ACH42_12605 [Endozoicomonas sp. (ex Bugula neritina AB1)]|nr:hypothetical protein ACH42_12605 [Endozoicomonas sp. (ex Bugula neritina AB1)]
MLTLQDQNTAYREAIVIMSDGDNYWFGSQTFGSFFTNNIIVMMEFLATAIHNLHKILNYTKVVINVKANKS